MAKADLGEKRVCAECAAKFFDLKKRPVVCPKCGFSFDPDTITIRGARKAPEEAKPEAEIDDETTEDDVNAVDGDSEVAEVDQQELSLDDAAPLLAASDDESDADAVSVGSSALPDGYSEEGVDDDSDILIADEDEDAKLVDEEELNTED